MTYRPKVSHEGYEKLLIRSQKLLPHHKYPQPCSQNSQHAYENYGSNQLSVNGFDFYSGHLLYRLNFLVVLYGPRRRISEKFVLIFCSTNLTVHSLAVTLHTTRSNIQKFYFLTTQHFVLHASQNSDYIPAQH